MVNSNSRIGKSLLNARVNLIFYFLSLILSFFSRKIFLDYLGVEFIGLTTTLQNLLGFLNLADLGIGASIGYVLYKPLFDKDERKINEIISVLGYLYNRIGIVILSAGIVLSCFLPMIFHDTDISLGVIYAVYYGFLASSLIGYFINYRQTLLGADQRNYIVTGYFQTATIIKTIIQMVVAIYWCNFYVWIIIELSFNVLYAFVLNYKIDKQYPWLKSTVALGKKHYGEYKIIITKAKQMFVHVLAGMGRNQLLPFLVYAFGNLTIVAYYGNYTIVTQKVQTLFDQFLNSTGAGVGNLIAEGNKQKTMEIYWELLFVRFAVAAFIVFSLYVLIDPFISIWLGTKYLLPKYIICILLLNVFLGQTRGTTEQFVYGYGLFHDVWAPIATLVITVGVGLIGGYFFGLAGVIMGDCSSSLLILHVWKPYFLFTQGFKEPILLYIKNLLHILAIIVLSFASSLFILKMVGANTAQGYLQWALYSLLSVTIYLIIFLSLSYFMYPPMRKFVKRVTKSFR